MLLPQKRRHQASSKQQSDRKQICDDESSAGARQQPPRVTKLVKRCTRNHIFDLSKRDVRAQAPRTRRKTEPNSPAADLTDFGQCAVIDDLRPDLLDSIDCLQHLGPNQHTATCRASYFRFARADGRWWIQHQEEENKRRNQRLLRQRARTPASP